MSELLLPNRAGSASEFCGGLSDASQRGARRSPRRLECGQEVEHSEHEERHYICGAITHFWSTISLVRAPEGVSIR